MNGLSKAALLRWTSGLLLGFAVLTAVTAWRQPEAPDLPVPKKVSSYSGAPVVPAEAPTPEIPIAPPAPPPLPDLPSVSVRTPVREAGFRESKEATWEWTLTGQVVTTQGPVAGLLVKAEWVMAFHPNAEETAMLKRGGARRDKDGVWWGKAVASTNESGFFSMEGLPAVQLRVSSGRQFQIAQPGGTVQLRTELP